MSIETTDIAGDALAEFVNEAKSRIAARIEARREDDERRRQERTDHEKAVADLQSRRDELSRETEGLQSRRDALAAHGPDITLQAARAALVMMHSHLRFVDFSIRGNETLAEEYLWASGWRHGGFGWGRGTHDGTETLRNAVAAQIKQDVAAAAGLANNLHDEAMARAGRTWLPKRPEPFS